MLKNFWGMAVLWAAISFCPSLAVAQMPVPVIDRAGATILVRNTVVALNHANQTGNYSVLRDLGAPEFIVNNTPADLAANFYDLRQTQLEMGPVAVITPVFATEPTVQQNGVLQLTGYFPTQPVRISFDLAYRFVGIRWRLLGISVFANKAPLPDR